MRKWKVLVPIALGINLAVLAFPRHPIEPGYSAQSLLQADKSQSIKPPDVLVQTSQALNRVARKATPAVVSISSIKEPGLEKSEMDLSVDPSDQALLGIGSGVIIRPDGVILTNNHVVQNARNVTVIFDDKHRLPAHLIGSDPKTDLALIQLEPDQKGRVGRKVSPNFPTLSFGDSDQIQVGDWILAVGSPFGLTRSVTSGIVSAIGRAQLGMLDTEDFIQTDAAINPGNSGGPLINIKGEIIGINTAIFSQSGGFVGIGFAIPSKIAQEVAGELLKNGRVIRGWLGMSTQDLDEDLAQYFHVEPNHGALVSDVHPNSPASRASLKEGDVVLSYDQIPIESARQLKILVAKTKEKKEIPIKISRQGKTQVRVALVLEQPLPKPVQMAGQAGNDPLDPRKLKSSGEHKTRNSPLSLGLIVEDIPPEFFEILGIPVESGAMVTHIRVGSPAFEAGIARGDVILSANQIPVHNAKDFMAFMRNRPKAKSSDITLLYIQRGPEEKVFVPLKTGA